MKKNYFFIFCFLFLIISGQNLEKKNNFCFYENKGQIITQKLKQNTDVKYLFNFNGLNVQLRKNGFSYDVFETKKINKEQSKQYGKNVLETVINHSENTDCKYKFHRVDFDFLDSNKNSEIIAEGKSDDYDNYSLQKNSNQYISKVHRYKKIIYKDVYPNIDAVFFKPDDSTKIFEYNFIIRPGGKISDIQLRLNGAKTELKNGKILMKLRFGEMQENIPDSWILIKNAKKNLNVSFKEISKGVYGFSSDIDTSENTIVIDPMPTRIWGTFYGGAKEENIKGIKTDENKNIYIFGNTYSATNIATIGSYQSDISMPPSNFITKFNTLGNREWGTYLNYSIIRDIDFDKNLNSYTTGSGGFLLKLDEFGNLVFNKTVSDNYSNITDPNSIAIDNDNLYLAGSVLGGALMAKLDLNGNKIWLKQNGGQTAVTILTHVFVNNNEITAVGATQFSTKNNAIALINSFPTNFNPYHSFDAVYGFYEKYNDKGDLLKSSLLNFSDSFDSTWVGCPFYADIVNNILIISGIEYSSKDKKIDWVVKKYDVSANKQISNTQFAFSPTVFYENVPPMSPPILFRDSYVVSSYIDKYGNVFFGATAPKNSNYATSGAYLENNGGTEKSFILKIKNDDNVDWLTYYGGNGITNNAYITRDKDDYIYIAGNSLNNTSGISTPGTFQQTQNSVDSYDIYIAKLKECYPSIPIPGNIKVCQRDNIVLQAPFGSSYQWNGPNNFSSTLQNPIINNAQAIHSGNYYCTINTPYECDQNVSINVIVNVTEVPKVTNIQQFCSHQNPPPTFENIDTKGENLKWYDDLGNELPKNTILLNGKTYFVTQTINGCESDKAQFQVQISSDGIMVQNYSDEFCNYDATIDLTKYEKNINTSSFKYFYEYYTSNFQIITDEKKYPINVGNNIINVKAYTNDGCEKWVQLILNVKPTPKINLPENVLLCKGQNITLDAGIGFKKYTWSNGETSQTITVSETGDYAVIVVNYYDCQSIAVSHVKVLGDINFTKIIVENHKATVLLSEPGVYQYSLDNINWQSSNVFENLPGGIYTVYVKNEAGCNVGNKSFSIFNLSNVITPNSDGINDTWKISGIEIYPDSTIEIFDRYNTLILNQKINGAFEWDGKSNNTILPEGTYWYVIKITDGRVLNGWILLKNRN